ncbi:MAG TPA: hypothetical protein VGI97_00520 [Gemmatimonadaceae bacterium]|jgi:hypothetical protein
MPDATEMEWLVTHREESETQYDYFATEEKATYFLRGLVGKAQYALLYQRIDFTVQVDVTVHGPRRRRKKEAKDSGKEDDHATGRVTPTKEGAATPRAEEVQGADTSGAPAPVPNTTSNLAGPVFDCEVDRYAGDGPCIGPIVYDPESKARLCGLHMTAATSVRAEWHRRNRARNRPVRVA